jgi:hypothetical protein
MVKVVGTQSILSKRKNLNQEKTTYTRKKEKKKKDWVTSSVVKA